MNVLNDFTTDRQDQVVKTAVIGAGISGLTAALRLQDHHQVTVFEAADRLGGHTHTHRVELHGEEHAIDSGFIVFNTETYPNFCVLLDELGIESQPTDMSFSVRWDARGLEYAGTGWSGLLAQRRNVANLEFWRMLADWWRFTSEAQHALKKLDDRTTVAEYLAEHRYSETFHQGYFLPLGSAVWSSPRAALGDFPIKFVLDFYRNHGMLGLPGHLKWRVIQGGSHRYVEAIRRRLRGPVHTDAQVIDVSRQHERLAVRVVGRPPEIFEHVVFACHSDQALRILGSCATAAEREVLSAFPYQTNSAILHTDASLLPRNPRAWASWNYRVADDESDAATVTYDMTRLQRLCTRQRFLVTLNSEEAIRPSSILRRMTYHHPVFTAGRSAAQRRHGELIDHFGASYCGAYWGNGFHEDGVNSALAVCRVLNEKSAADRSSAPRCACLVS